MQTGSDLAEVEFVNVSKRFQLTEGGSLREFLPAEASFANPVDMIASATPESYQRALEVDHIIPLADGGTHTDTNLRSACSRCHKRRTAIDQSGWGS